MSTLTLRASSTDRAWLCPESLMMGPETVRVEQTGEPAELGSAFHEWARRALTGDEPDIVEIGERYGVELDELERLIAYSMVAERELRKWFGDGDTEEPTSYVEPWDCEPYDSIELTGTIDRRRLQGDVAAILDWKTGRVEGQYAHQQRAYAFLTARNHPEITTVHSVLAYVRLGYWKATTYNVADMESWWDDLKRRLRNGLGRFNPGETQCGYCGRRATCPGVAAHDRKALATVAEHPDAANLAEENKHTLGPVLAEALRKVSYIENRCSDFRAALKRRVKAIGEVPAGNGTVLRIETQERRELDAKKAWPVLVGHMEDEKIAGACKISLTKCQQVVADKAERGQKGHARTALAEELESAGAISRKKIESMKECSE